MRSRRYILNYSLALLSGILLALSFPRFGHPVFAWVALAPLLVALLGGGRQRGGFQARRAFTLGLVAGAVYFAGTVYWTGEVVRTFGGLGWPVAALTAAALVGYLALFPGLFALTVGWIGCRMGASALALVPAIWVTSELARTHFWSGFPWVLLGYSQTTVLPVAQLASVTGVYGLSALVALASATLAHLAMVRSRGSMAGVGAVVALVVAIGVWGANRVRESELIHQGVSLRIGVVQGNIPQDQKWDPAYANAILGTYLGMTRQAAEQGARLVIWPESSTPFYYEEDRFGAERIRAVVRSTGIELLLGSDQIEETKPPAYYNAAFLLRPDGSTAAVYRKVYLVPFGEYVPLKQLLFFVEPLVEGVGDFSPGRALVMLPVAGGKASTAICYEIVYPGLIRASVLAGSQLLTTITNDAWYGRSSAPFQHFVQASMRAIEQGRYLVRSANTGISGIVDPYGRVLERSDLFERATLVTDVRLLGGLTIYGRIGDLFAYLCAGLTLAALIPAGRAGRTGR